MKDYVKKAMKKAAKNIMDKRALVGLNITTTSASPGTLEINQCPASIWKDKEMDVEKEVLEMFKKETKKRMTEIYAELLKKSAKILEDKNALEIDIKEKDKLIEEKRQDNLEYIKQNNHMKKTINFTDSALHDMKDKAQEKIARIRALDEEGKEAVFIAFFYHLAGYVQATANQGLNLKNRDDDGY